jgi:hypothetical protein
MGSFPAYPKALFPEAPEAGVTRNPPVSTPVEVQCYNLRACGSHSRVHYSFTCPNTACFESNEGRLAVVAKDLVNARDQVSDESSLRSLRIQPSRRSPSAAVPASDVHA